jgi:hypothetical protein
LATSGQGLDQAADFQRKLEQRGLTITGEQQIRSKEHAALEASRLVFEQFEHWGG